MDEVKRCPRCGAELAADAAQGLCPKCLFDVGMAPQSEAPRTTASAASGFVPPLPADLNAQFPHLDFLELLGKGGMGAVYKAKQRSLDRVVAVKILPPEVGLDPNFADRFTREARALARLNHPHIVAIHDFGHAGNFYFFVMEFVDGVNLRMALRAHQLTPPQALQVVPQICDALQYAHEEGIVHRDIKPENILLDKRGRVKIADFGLAKLLGKTAEDLTLTGTKQIVGTVPYMAPEQIEGSQDVDHRADIYSLGVTFYEMLTGELPLGRFPPPSRKVEIDVRLDEVVLRTLEKSPDLRYQQAGEIKVEVETISRTPPRSQPSDWWKAATSRVFAGGKKAADWVSEQLGSDTGTKPPEQGPPSAPSSPPAAPTPADGRAVAWFWLLSLIALVGVCYRLSSHHERLMVAFFGLVPLALFAVLRRGTRVGRWARTSFAAIFFVGILIPGIIHEPQVFVLIAVGAMAFLAIDSWWNRRKNPSQAPTE